MVVSSVVVSASASLVVGLNQTKKKKHNGAVGSIAITHTNTMGIAIVPFSSSSSSSIGILGEKSEN